MDLHEGFEKYLAKNTKFLDPLLDIIEAIVYT